MCCHGAQAKQDGDSDRQIYSRLGVTRYFTRVSAIQPFSITSSNQRSWHVITYNQRKINVYIYTNFVAITGTAGGLAPFGVKTYAGSSYRVPYIHKTDTYKVKKKHIPLGALSTCSAEEPWWRYWPFVRGIHRSPVNSPYKGQWRGALMLSLVCTWINGWVNNREAGDLRRHTAHYDVTEMNILRTWTSSWRMYFRLAHETTACAVCLDMFFHVIVLNHYVHID